jgi:hypothetical protein
MSVNGNSINKSSIVYRRNQVGVDCFKEIYDNLLQIYNEECNNNSVTKVAHQIITDIDIVLVDGSQLIFPYKFTEQYNFKPSNSNQMGYGSLSGIYDSTNDIWIDMTLSNTIAERQIFINQYKSLPKKSLDKRLFIFDRGYWNRQIAETLICDNSEFIFRMNKMHAITASKKPWGKSGTDLLITHCLHNNNDVITPVKLYSTNFTIRFVKYTVNNNDYLIATSLLDQKKYTIEIIKKLYFKRWEIEEEYKLLKNMFNIDLYNCKSFDFYKQQFYVIMSLYVLMKIMHDKYCILDKTEQCSNSTHKTKQNKKYYLKTLINHILPFLLSTKNKLKNVLVQLKRVFKTRVYCKENRSNPRISKTPYTKWYWVGRDRIYKKKKCNTNAYNEKSKILHYNYNKYFFEPSYCAFFQ